jgi:hypothetical protein
MKMMRRRGSWLQEGGLTLLEIKMVGLWVLLEFGILMKIFQVWLCPEVSEITVQLKWV